MKKLMQEFGPVLAGFQLATYLVGFFGIGAFASWVLNTWRPFTHWVWDNFFNWLHLPTLTNLEKDALTAVLFFLPMAGWALFSRYVLGKKGPFTKFTMAAAGIAAALFLYLVAGKLIIETIIMSTQNIQEAKQLGADAVNTKELDVSYYIVISLAVALIATLLKIIHFSSWRALTGFKRYIARVISSKILIRMYNFVFYVSSIATIFVFLLGITFNIGWIRGIAIFSVLGCIALTLKLDPRRLLVSTGALVAFVISSALFEFAVWTIKQMNNLSS